MLEEIENKIVDKEKAILLVRSWQEKGLQVVWTNGCFDLLHAGHITYLAQAKGAGNRLIVGVNSDASVKKLKGPSRPIFALEHRLLNLAAMQAVDLVIPFNDETPLELIKALKPDILIKGGDYQAHQVVGGSEVLAWGGVVQIIPFLDGHSSTSIINKIKSS